MNDHKLKLLNEKPAEAPAQPSFPFVNVNITPQGLVITTHLTPASAFTQVLALETLRQILPQLKELLRQEQNQMEIIRHIEKSKIN